MKESRELLVQSNQWNCYSLTSWWRYTNHRRATINLFLSNSSLLKFLCGPAGTYEYPVVVKPIKSTANESKAVPLKAMQVLRGTKGIAPTHS
jgi:hypothetical protein